MSNRVDQEFTRVVTAMSETAPTKPELTLDGSPTAHSGIRRRRMPAFGLAAASVVVVILGVVGVLAVVTGQDQSAPVVLAMGSSEEPAVAVGTFPALRK